MRTAKTASNDTNAAMRTIGRRFDNVRARKDLDLIFHPVLFLDAIHRLALRLLHKLGRDRGRDEGVALKGAVDISPVDLPQQARVIALHSLQKALSLLLCQVKRGQRETNLAQPGRLERFSVH